MACLLPFYNDKQYNDQLVIFVQYCGDELNQNNFSIIFIYLTLYNLRLEHKHVWNNGELSLTMTEQLMEYIKHQVPTHSYFCLVQSCKSCFMRRIIYYCFIVGYWSTHRRLCSATATPLWRQAMIAPWRPPLICHCHITIAPLPRQYSAMTTLLQRHGFVSVWANLYTYALNLP